jgi:hypothetical protein
MVLVYSCLGDRVRRIALAFAYSLEPQLLRWHGRLGERSRGGKYIEGQKSK